MLAQTWIQKTNLNLHFFNIKQYALKKYFFGGYGEYPCSEGWL